MVKPAQQAKVVAAESLQLAKLIAAATWIFLCRRCRCVWRCLPFTCRRMIGNSEHSEVEALVALFAILFFNIGVATLNELEKGVRLKYMVLYTAVGIIAIWPMFYITSRSIKSQGSEMFYYDRSTVQIGKWLTFCCALLFATFVCSGFRGEWVGQQGKDLTVNDIRLTSFDNGVPCMRMQIIATPAHFNGRVPNQVDLLAQIPEEVAAIWSFTTASWVRADGSSAYIVSKGPIREIVEEASLVEDKDQPAGPVDVVYRGLPSEDGIYKLYIDLKPTDQRTKVITSEYLAASSDEQRDDVARNAKDAFKKQFDDAKAKLLAPGGAKVFLKPKAGIELW